MSAKNISVKVSGNPDSNSGFIPLILFNNPQFDIEDKEYGGFDDCSFFFTIKRLKDRTIYKLVKNNVRSNGAVRAGSLVIAFSIPRNYRLDGGYTPYDVLIALKDEFLKSCMTCKDPVRGTYEFNSARIDQHVLDEVASRFTIFEYPTPNRIMNPSGPVGYIVKDEDGIIDLFKDSFYPEFDRFSEVIVASAASQPSYIPITNIEVPRQKRYTLILNGVKHDECSDINKLHTVKADKPEKYYNVRTEEFTIKQLKDGERFDGIDLDEAGEQVIVSTRGKSWATPKERKITLHFIPEEANNFFLHNKRLLTLYSPDHEVILLANDLSFKLVGEKIDKTQGLRLSIAGNNDYKFIDQTIEGDKMIVNVEKKKIAPPVQYNSVQRPGQISGNARGHQIHADNNALQYPEAANMGGSKGGGPVKGSELDLLKGKPAPFNREYLLLYVSVIFGVLLLGYVLGFFTHDGVSSLFSKKEISATSGFFSKTEATQFLNDADKKLSQTGLTFLTVDSLYNDYTTYRDTLEEVSKQDDKLKNVIRKITDYHAIVYYLRNKNVDSIRAIAERAENEAPKIALSHAGILTRIKEDTVPFAKADKEFEGFSEIENLYKYRCPEANCDEKFDTKEELDKHINGQHPSTIKSQSTKQGKPQTTTQENTHKTQGIAHTDTGEHFACEICGPDTWFNTKKELEAHKNSDTHKRKEASQKKDDRGQ